MIRLRLIDLFKGTNVHYWYKHFQSLNFSSRNEVIKYQNNKLERLIIYSYNNVDYYKMLFKKHNLIPDDIRSVNDLMRLPIIDRDIIRENLKLLKSNEINISKMHKGSSSGTTGIPITYYKCINGLSAGIASLYILSGMTGCKIGDRSVHIWGNATTIKRWNTLQSRIKNYFINQLNIASSFLDSNKGISESLEKIIRHNPESIDGYPSSIYAVAKYLEKNKISIDKVKQVITTAENLEPNQRDLIEKYLGPTSDLYGSGEVLGIAIRPISDEKYYIFDPNVIVEAVESGIEGMKNLIVTDLNNYGMPLIRYKIGDLIDDVFEPDETCKMPFTYFNKLIGRSSEIIILPNGRRFHPVNIFGGTHFRKFKNINRHKVIWNGEKLTFVFEVTENFNDTELKLGIDMMLNDYNVNYRIQYTNKIQPSSSGKYKYMEIINK